MEDDVRRIANALESIAKSLHKLAHPPIVVSDYDGGNILPGTITYVSAKK